MHPLMKDGQETCQGEQGDADNLPEMHGEEAEEEAPENAEDDMHEEEQGHEEKKDDKDKDKGVEEGLHGKAPESPGRLK
jgi:hypothetical protein